MNVHTFTREEVLRRLLTSEAGLRASEAGKRLQEYGLNEITEVRKTPLTVKFLSQFTHFLAILLWLATGLCFLSEYLRPGEGLLSLGIAIIGVIIINAVFTFIQEYRAERALTALKALLPFNVRVIRDGAEREMPAREVVPGDLVLLAEGDKVPADARLVEANRLMVNNAPLTGESDPKPRSAEPFQGEYLDSPNLVFAGTLVVSGKGLAVALATGMATEFGKIAHLTGAVEPGLSPLQREFLAQFPLRHRHHYRQRAGGPPAHGDPLFGHGLTAHGQKKSAHQEPQCRGDAGLGYRYLLRQDGHPHPEPHGGRTPVGAGGGGNGPRGRRGHAPENRRAMQQRGFY
jgi:sodium/potassium-transporting ATPase subunit alpha